MSEIMSIEEARELLGKDYEYMTDIQVLKLLDDVDLLATLAIRVAKEEIDKGNLTNSSVVRKKIKSNA